VHVRSRGGDECRGWSLPSLAKLRESLGIGPLLGFHESQRRTTVHVQPQSFIVWRNRGPLPTEKRGAPDQGVCWIERETQIRFELVQG
jgi:hypothetical protein